MSTVERFATNLRRERRARNDPGRAGRPPSCTAPTSLLEKAKRDPKLTTIAKLAHGHDAGQAGGGIDAER
jgi:hypothetical protein